MQLELLSASNFLVHLIRMSRRSVDSSSGPVGESQLVKFRDSLIEVLKRRYRDHWFPEKPFKGSGFRCIRINGKMDSVIGKAGEDVGLSAEFLHKTFPGELTMWIDPKEVSYRIGENGSICILYEHSDGVSEPWNPPATTNNASLNSASDKKTAKKESTSSIQAVAPQPQKRSAIPQPPQSPAPAVTGPPAFSQPRNLQQPPHTGPVGAPMLTTSSGAAILAPNVVNSNKNLVRTGQQQQPPPPQMILQQPQQQLPPSTTAAYSHIGGPPPFHLPHLQHHHQQQPFYMMDTCNKEANTFRPMDCFLNGMSGMPGMGGMDHRKPAGGLSIDQLAAFVSS